MDVNVKQLDNVENELLSIENDGQKIVSSNYWNSEIARNGMFVMSINEKCFRLMLPDTADGKKTARELRTGVYAVLSYGIWYSPKGPRRSFEILAEDGSRNPFSVQLCEEQVDRLPSKTDDERTDLTLRVYLGGPKQVLELPARFRIVESLPYLKPWGM